VTALPGPLDLVRRLVDAENAHDRAQAEPIIARECTITRARGVEQGSDALLDEIEHPRSSTIRRDLVDASWIRESGAQAVVRSIVTTRDESAPGDPPKTFRNLHVFEQQDGHWKCIAWQVTELK
jgi:hypothetical protein